MSPHIYISSHYRLPALVPKKQPRIIMGIVGQHKAFYAFTQTASCTALILTNYVLLPQARQVFCIYYMHLQICRFRGNGIISIGQAGFSADAVVNDICVYATSSEFSTAYPYK
jgi:hypothetical protein